MAFFEITSRDLLVLLPIGFNLHKTFSIQVLLFQRNILCCNYQNVLMITKMLQLIVFLDIF